MSTTRTAVSSQALAAHEDFCRAAAEGERLEIRDQNLSSASFVDALLAGAIFEGCDLKNADFNGADLTGARFLRCDLARANLTDTCLNNARLEASSLDEVQLVGAEMSSCVIVNSSFMGANLSRANLYQASIEGASFIGSRAAHARLKRASLVRCDFADADLSEVDAGRATFRSVDLRRCLLRAMRLDATSFSDCGFAGVMGLPQIDGRVMITDPDISPRRDQSGIRDQEFFRERWGNPWDPEGAWLAETV